MEIVSVCIAVVSSVILILSSAAYGQQTSINFDVLEEQPPFTYIGNVAEESNIQDNKTQTEIARLRYQILTKGNLHATLFVINQITGRLESAVVLDREKLCQPTLNCILGLDVAVYLQDEQDPSKLTDLLVVLKLSIQILDMNDNSPSFPEQTIRIEFSESSSVGTEVLIDTASDYDSGDRNSVQTYEIIDPENTFLLQELKNVDDSKNLAILLDKRLDSETKDSYQVTIVAKDGGSPPRSGSVIVNIDVVDANDNKPTFTKSPYNVTLREDVPVGSSILTVSASDLDKGENGILTYKFSSKIEAFSINSTTGEITLKSELDYDDAKEREFSLVVEAEDQGDPPQTAQVLVLVKVLDVNDNAPQININLPPGGKDVSELAAAGLYIANVVVSDKDSGENGTVTCNIESDKFTLVKFSKEIYKINLQAPLDREKQAVHNVSVVCSDGGVPKMTNRTFFTINVKDENDNFPVFNQSKYNVSITENNDIGDALFTIQADDKDAGSNGEVTYRLLDRTDYFSINPSSGIITCNIVFDRENITSISFRVLATDNGSPQRSTSATVVVNVADENDETPLFYGDSYVFYIAENQQLSTVIGNVSAYDNDSGSNSAFTFSVEKGYSKFFRIDSHGNIRSRVVLDREVRQEYEFAVIVTDKGVPPKSSSASVTVYVRDENDNVPVIFYPNTNNNSLNINLNTAPGNVIASVLANDSDKGVNAALSYFIIQGNVNSLFRMNNVTGQLTLQKTLNEKDAGTYTLVLAVQDRGVPQRATWTNLIVVVGNKTDAKNLIIVISVCSVTLFISLALIVTICIIRRNDNNTFQERRVRFENQEKSLFFKWFKCLSVPSKHGNYSNGVERVKDVNRQASQNSYVDTRPIILSSGDSSTSDDVMDKQIIQMSSSKSELTRSDSGIAELSGGSTSPPQSYKGDINDNNPAEIDLTSSYPGSFTFVDNNLHSTSSNAAEMQLNNSVGNDRPPMPPPNPYHRYVSVDEDFLRNPQKQKIYFARFRSSSESESCLNDNADREVGSHLSNSANGGSFKQSNNNIVHDDLNKSYSGPFYITSSLERKPRSHYAYPRTNFSQNSSRPATRRELPTISATPEPAYDPIQELNAISYQDNDVSIPSSPRSRNSNQGQTTQPHEHSHQSYDGSRDNVHASPYDLQMEEKMFNRDVIV